VPQFAAHSEYAMNTKMMFEALGIIASSAVFFVLLLLAFYSGSQQFFWGTVLTSPALIIAGPVLAEWIYERSRKEP